MDSSPPPVSLATRPRGDIQNTNASSKERDIYRYRKQRGVNLGSWFVLERWIVDAPFRFAQAPGQSDHDVARGSYANQVLERHWDDWIIEDDWAWMARHGVNTVRIPIGYYHICGVDPSVLPGTDFAELGPVFEGAWDRITNAIETAHRYGIGVLIDLHAAPGKQNNDSHSGTSLPATFFSQKKNMQHTIHVLGVLLLRLRALPHPNVVGIELINEPAPPNDHALQSWYTSAIRQLRGIDPEMPIYLGECWRTDQYAEYVAALPQPVGIVALDHHLYRCFTAEDTHTPVAQHTRNLVDPSAGTPSMFARVSQKVGGSLIVGEWSGALNPGSLSSSHDEDKDRREYISAQLELYEKYCAGYFFWTYKKQHRGDKGWCFRDAVEGGVYPAWMGLKATRDCTADEDVRSGRRNSLKDQALADHSRYWSQYPGNYEHWRFDDGFISGWDDAYQFLASSSQDMDKPVSELGFKGAWAKKRAGEHAARKGGGKGLWEFEHGFNQGADAARKDFLENYC